MCVETDRASARGVKNDCEGKAPWLPRQAHIVESTGARWPEDQRVLEVLKRKPNDINAARQPRARWVPIDGRGGARPRVRGGGGKDTKGASEREEPIGDDERPDRRPARGGDDPATGQQRRTDAWVRVLPRQQTADRIRQVTAVTTKTAVPRVAERAEKRRTPLPPRREIGPGRALAADERDGRRRFEPDLASYGTIPSRLPPVHPCPFFLYPRRVAIIVAFYRYRSA